MQGRFTAALERIKDETSYASLAYDHDGTVRELLDGVEAHNAAQVRAGSWSAG